MKDEKEVLSENFSVKRKRGRPRLMQPEFENSIRMDMPYSDIRTIQNNDYEARAGMILGISPDNPPDYPFSWLCDFGKIEFGKSQRRAYRKTILSELGRIEQVKNLIEAATEICRLKPKTQDAVKMIRGWRLRRPVVSETLESTLRIAIKNYRKKHPEIANNDIHESLIAVFRIMRLDSHNV